jgi:hypothetical protein
MSTDGGPEPLERDDGEPRQRPFGELAELLEKAGRRK